MIVWILTFAGNGFLLATIGLTTALALRGRAAAWRHLVLAVTVVGLLLLPAAACVPPRVQWSVGNLFPAVGPAEPQPVAAHELELVDEFSPTGAHAEPTATDVSTAGSLPPESDEAAAPTSVDRPTPARTSIPPVPLDVATGSARWTPTWTALLAALWGLGAISAAAIPVTGLWAIRRARRDSQPWCDPVWQRLLTELCHQVGVSSPVQLRRSTTVVSAITWGWLRPVILLPDKAEHWTTSQRTVALLHELGHIRRHDWLLQMLAAAGCTVHWFNPLVWWIGSRMRWEREQACDDFVLQSGVDPAEYASRLLELAKQFRTAGPATAIPMIAPSRLEQRLRRILDRRLRRDPPSYHMVRATAAVCGMLLLPMALIGATMETPSRPQEKAGASTVVDDTGSPAAEATAVAQAGPAEVIRVINGEDGRPIAGAEVVYDPQVDPSSIGEDTLTAVVRTNERGEVTLPQDTLGYLKFRVTHPFYLRGRFAATGATLPGWTLYRSEWPYGSVDGQKVLKLWPGETLSGRVHFRDGRPARQIKFQVVSRATEFGWYRGVVLPREAAAMGPVEPREGVEWRCDVQTDKSGRFSVAVPPRAVRGPLQALGYAKQVAPFGRAVEVGDADIEIERGVIVRGTFRDANGNPVARMGVSLYPVLPDGERGSVELHRSATTDEQGRFEFAPSATGPHLLRPHHGIPRRFDLQAGAPFEIDAELAPQVDLKFDFENSLGSLSGNFNFSLRGDVFAPEGGDAVRVVATTFKDPGDKITIRAPRAMQNAQLHYTGWSLQTVRIIDESGNVFLPSVDAKPIPIPDLLNPPKLKIYLDKAARFYVNVREADGAVARGIQVTAVAIGEYGRRKVGSFHRSGDVWERGGLRAGERVIVTVRRGDWSLTSKPSEPVLVEASDPTNKMDFQLPAMTVTAGRPREGVFFGYSGVMTYVIELKDGRFRYWFESDAKSRNEPEYPLTGKYTVAGDTITLHHPALISLSSIWKCRSVNGVPTLWRRDALQQHDDSPLRLSVDELQKWGAASILAYTTKSADHMWKHRTAPSR